MPVPLLLWDASALVKLFIPEQGSDIVAWLFSGEARSRMAVTILGYAETNGILIRKYNQGVLDSPTYRAALAALQSGVLSNSDFTVLNVAFEDVLDGIGLMATHNLNTSDAALLVTYLRYISWEKAEGHGILVTADRRLIRAASLEGLLTLDPETETLEAVQQRLSTLV